MAENTLIAWTNHTHNIAWGCTKIDPGCAHCYAERFATKRLGLEIWGPNQTRRTFGTKHWMIPEKWHRAAMAGGTTSVMGPGYPVLVFSSSMCDVFEDHPTLASEREKLWALIRRTPHLHWQLLTKRADRIADYLPSDWGSKGYPNVWLGVSISDSSGVWRADCLRQVPARVRFISYEPALGPLVPHLNLDGIHWVIYGGESGHHYRDHDLEWPRAMRAHCREKQVAFFYKQSAAPRTEMETLLDGETVREFPSQRLRSTPDPVSLETIPRPD